jgi:polysaccharide export outer membrane protein
MLMRKLSGVLLILLITFSFSGCINQDIMFKTPKDYEFDVPPDTIAEQYILQPNDIFFFRLFANDGFKLIDITNMTGNSNMSNANLFNNNSSLFQYFIEFDGSTKLPILGRVNLAGYTLRQAELYLQKEYAYSFNDPFVQLSVLNRRVFVFPGESGRAAVIGLQNNNTTLMEALALAGGLSENGKAQKVKLIRKSDNPAEPLVYEFDLSRIEGLKYANMIVQTEDIIYVQPRKRIGRELLTDLTPWITLLTSLLLTITTLQALAAINSN